MLGCLFHRVEILVTGATAAVSEVVEQGFPCRRGILPDSTAHDFREGLASKLGVAEFRLGVEFQCDCLYGRAQKMQF